MNVNKYAILSLLLGLVLFAGTYAWQFQSAGIGAALLTMLYGGLLWVGFLFFVIGLLMILL